jgi:hypothetical protein
MNSRSIDSKAVSEILGYILVFGMIVVAVSLIYMQVYPELKRQQEISVFKAMEDLFTVLQGVERLVAYNVSQSKTVSLRIEEGDIYATRDFGCINISINGSWHNCSYGAIVYEVGNSKIILENGAVIECFGDDCIMLSKPRMFNRSGNVFISIINASGRLAFTGFGQMTFENCGSKIVNKTTNASVNITFHPSGDVNTTRVWIKYFVEDLGFRDVGNNTVNATGVNVTIAIHNVSIS